MEDLATGFWRLMDQADFDGLAELLAADATIRLPNTREVFRGASSYIAFNKAYPGRWHALVASLIDLGDRIITTVKIWSEEGGPSFYVTSYFAIRDGKIGAIDEYWGENSEPPDWRLEKGLSERY